MRSSVVVLGRVEASLCFGLTFQHWGMAFNEAAFGKTREVLYASHRTTWKTGNSWSELEKMTEDVFTACICRDSS